MSTNLENLQRQYEKLQTELRVLTTALNQSIPGGSFALRAQSGGSLFLRDEESLEILHDSISDVISLKQNQLTGIVAKLEAIEELLKG